MSKKAGGLKYFSEESTGFKIQPKTVLIMSLIYIGLVVLLHIYAKLGAKPTIETPPAPEPAEAPSAAQPEPEQQEAAAEDLWMIDNTSKKNLSYQQHIPHYPSAFKHSSQKAIPPEILQYRLCSEASPSHQKDSGPISRSN